VATLALLAVCTAVTRAQLPHWRDSIRLWTHALEVSGEDPRMLSTVGQTALQEEKPDVAVRHAERLVQVQPDRWASHRFLGSALAAQGKWDEAAASLARAVDLRPDSADLRKQLSRFLWLADRIPEACEQLAEVARLEPDSAEGLHYRGTVLQRKGKLDDAVRALEGAVRLVPQSPLYRCDLAFALEEQGDHVAAGDHYKQALRDVPQWPAENDRLARILASHPDARRRDGAEAVRRARQACYVSGYRFPPFLETLAAAYAEAGQFEQAITTAEGARRQALEAQDTRLAGRLEGEVSLYRKKQPFRDEALKRAPRR
jgi:Flp pilus assembly protein TadD